MQGSSPDVILVAADAARLPVSLSSAIPATVHLAFYIGAAFIVSRETETEAPAQP